MNKLKGFIVQAKKETYANENVKEILVKGCGKILTYKSKEFEYQDKYLGFNPFFGKELVTKRGKIIWGMNYIGQTKKKNKIFSKKIYLFLKGALRKCDLENPFRGPKKYSKENFEYFNSTRGDFSFFEGKEKIFYKGKEVYECNYHGGLIK